MLSIISFFSFNLEFTNVKKLRAVTFDEFLFITEFRGRATIENFWKKSSEILNVSYSLHGLVSSAMRCAKHIDTFQ